MLLQESLIDILLALQNWLDSNKKTKLQIDYKVFLICLSEIHGAFLKNHPPPFSTPFLHDHGIFMAP